MCSSHVKGNWAVNELQQDSVSVAQAATANMADEYTAIDFDGPGGDDPVEFAHDHNGNLKDDGTYLYDYDIENRMTRVRQKSGGDTIAVYQYDAMGRRIRKTVSNLGSGIDGTFEFVNSPEWQVLEWHRIAGYGVIFDVTYVHAGQSAYIDDHVALANGTDPWGFYHTDAQYNTLTTTNSIGDVGQRYLLDPYGHMVVYNSTWTSVSLAPPVGLLFVHQGLVFDGEAGKYQNRYREYMPILGRFAQRDPLESISARFTSDYNIAIDSGYLSAMLRVGSTEGGVTTASSFDTTLWTAIQADAPPAQGLSPSYCADSSKPNSSTDPMGLLPFKNGGWIEIIGHFLIDCDTNRIPQPRINPVIDPCPHQTSVRYCYIRYNGNIIGQAVHRTITGCNPLHLCEGNGNPERCVLERYVEPKCDTNMLPWPVCVNGDKDCTCGIPELHI